MHDPAAWPPHPCMTQLHVCAAALAGLCPGPALVSVATLQDARWRVKTDLRAGKVSDDSLRCLKLPWCCNAIWPEQYEQALSFVLGVDWITHLTCTSMPTRISTIVMHVPSIVFVASLVAGMVVAQKVEQLAG
eukprot:1152171-Pelagomonas_calceolata.AAC.2